MSAAGVHHRLPPRRTGLRLWGMRFVGLLATAVLLGVGAFAALTAVPDGSDETALVPVAPASTPDASKPAADTEPRRPKFTRAQRRARAAAVNVLRDQGYRPVTLTDYKPDKTLRVLVGRGDGGQRAFFFAGGSFLGHDALDDSHRIEIVRAGNRSVSLQYRLFRTDDRPCCPSAGKVRVLFRWDGESLAAQTAIPPASERRAPTG